MAKSELTRREMEVAELMALGLTNREIADELVIEWTTVRKHLYIIYGKLDAHNRVEAVRKFTAKHGSGDVDRIRRDLDRAIGELMVVRRECAHLRDRMAHLDAEQLKIEQMINA